VASEFDGLRLPLPDALFGSGNFFDMIISAPPVRPRTTSNSSMKERIKNIPRPDVLNRFFLRQRVRHIGQPETLSFIQHIE